MTKPGGTSSANTFELWELNYCCFKSLWQIVVCFKEIDQWMIQLVMGIKGLHKCLPVFLSLPSNIDENMGVGMISWWGNDQCLWASQLKQIYSFNSYMGRWPTLAFLLYSELRSSCLLSSSSPQLSSAILSPIEDSAAELPSILQSNSLSSVYTYSFIHSHSHSSVFIIYFLL